MSLVQIEVNGIEYHSYASVDEANEYLAVDAVYKSSWSALTAEVRGEWLIYATRIVDGFNYSGEANGDTQFPRDGATDIPVEVERATILLAAYYASVNPTVPRSSNPRLKKIRDASGSEIEYFRSGAASLPELPETRALSLLRAFFSTPVGSLSLDFNVSKEEYMELPRDRKILA